MTAVPNTGAKSPDQLVTEAARLVADEFKAAGIKIHAVELKVWRSPREVFASATALTRDGIVPTTQEVKA